MKKKQLKKLKFNKSRISDLNENEIKGGTLVFSGERATCPEPFVQTLNITICWGRPYCEIRDNGC
ncbi:class I lanthipeptide [Flavobacteriaceae bacterium M23B6Z8]